MAYSELLADRIRAVLDQKKIARIEKKMMGGLSFMVDDKMCIGIVKESLMCRIDPEVYPEALSKTACRKMDFTGREMKGFVFVDPHGIDMEEELEYWIQLCLDYNPKARSSKKKRN